MAVTGVTTLIDGTCRVHPRPAEIAAGALTLERIRQRSPPIARVTHDQIVRLYQLVAVESGDEMMGLWSRPIRDHGSMSLTPTRMVIPQSSGQGPGSITSPA